jgi:hypothetical protein
VEITTCKSHEKTLQDCLTPSYGSTTYEANIPVRSSSVPNVDLLGHEIVVPAQQSNEAEVISYWPHQDCGSSIAFNIKTGQQHVAQTTSDLMAVNNLIERSSAAVPLSDDNSIGFEPDIVQSTKASSLNRQGKMPIPQPVAPPRKKKSAAPSPPSVGNEQVSF